MAIRWAMRRQLIYYAVFGVVGFFTLLGGYQAFLSGAPTCSDGVQNQNERGVDCGGACALVCKADVREPVVLWARSFKSSPGNYTAAAYVQNGNSGAGAHRVSYTFQLFDAANLLVVERRGTIDVPPTQTVPIIETNIDTGTREVARTLFAFTTEPEWRSLTRELPQLRTTNLTLEQGGGRLSATLLNDSRTDAPRVSVVAVLFDVNGVAVAASKAQVSVPRRGEEFVVFTWSPAPPDVARAEITILPPF